MKINFRTRDAFVNYTVSMVLAIFVGFLLIRVQGGNPKEAYYWIIKGAIGTKSGLSSSLRWMTPVIFASLSAVVAQTSGLINLGIEGQLYFGALIAGIIGAFIPGPRIIMLPLVILSGGFAGLLYALLPALLRIFCKINEMITTLMMNYVAIQVTEFITLKIMRMDSNVNPDLIATPEIPKNIALTRILPPYQASSGIFIAIILGVGLYFFYKKTYRGFEWKMLGLNNLFARYGGVNETRSYIKIFLLSGFIAGCCGAFEILGPHLRFRTGFSTNIGWDGIMVSLIANNNIITSLFVSGLWGCIKAGSLTMERMSDVNRVLVTLIQAIFVLFITVDIVKFAGNFIVRWKGKKMPREEKE